MPSTWWNVPNIQFNIHDALGDHWADLKGASYALGDCWAATKKMEPIFLFKVSSLYLQVL